MEQRARLLEQGAEAHGLQGSVRTTERVAALIKKQFGVSSHPAHTSRLLKRIRHNMQQPVERATQREEETITTWKEVRWPEPKSPTRGQNDHFRERMHLAVVLIADQNGLTTPLCQSKIPLEMKK